MVRVRHGGTVDGGVYDAGHDGVDPDARVGQLLGKQLALQIAPAIGGDSAALEAQDGSTRALIDWYRTHRA